MLSYALFMQAKALLLQVGGQQQAKLDRSLSFGLGFRSRGQAQAASKSKRRLDKLAAAREISKAAKAAKASGGQHRRRRERCAHAEMERARWPLLH